MPTMVASVKTLFLLLAFHLTDSMEYLFCFADLRHSIFFFQTDFFMFFCTVCVCMNGSRFHVFFFV